MLGRENHFIIVSFVLLIFFSCATEHKKTKGIDQEQYQLILQIASKDIKSDIRVSNFAENFMEYQVFEWNDNPNFEIKSYWIKDEFMVSDKFLRIKGGKSFPFRQWDDQMSYVFYRGSIVVTEVFFNQEGKNYRQYWLSPEYNQRFVQSSKSSDLK